MLFVDYQTRQNRMAICRACPHFVAKTESCGTLILGGDAGESNVVKRGRGKIKLCGCYMPFKSKFKAVGCPLKKWDAQITPKELDEWESKLAEMQSAGVATAKQQEWLTATLTRATGVARQATNCPPCLKSMVEELHRYILQNRHAAKKN